MEPVSFLVQLATLIRPEHYEGEFKIANQLYDQLKQKYTKIVSDEDLKLFILLSYKIHDEPLSYQERMDYIAILFMLEYYKDVNGTYISNLDMEIKSRTEFLEKEAQMEVDSFSQNAIFEITYDTYIDQVTNEKSWLLKIPQMKIKQ